MLYEILDVDFNQRFYIYPTRTEKGIVVFVEDENNTVVKKIKYKNPWKLKQMLRDLKELGYQIKRIYI